MEPVHLPLSKLNLKLEEKPVEIKGMNYDEIILQNSKRQYNLQRGNTIEIKSSIMHKHFLYITVYKVYCI
jgi:hypothetical protein